MGTQAALMMAMTTVSILLPLVVIKYYVKQIILRRSGEEQAHRTNEAGRLVIISVTSALMFTLVMTFGHVQVAPELMAAAY